MRNNNKRRSTLSINAFIVELGEGFSDHMREKLMELESRCYLTRREASNRFDLKHVEHVQYEQLQKMEKDSVVKSKEYAYGQFVVVDSSLYFSDKCFENHEIMQSPEVADIFDSLSSSNMLPDEDTYIKMIDSSNIDFVVDKILAVCPQTSQAYLEIVRGMMTRASNK